MRTAYRALAALVALGVLVQAGAIAYAWFEVINRMEAGGTFSTDPSTWNAGHAVHGVNGMTVLPVVALLLLVVSFFARLPGGVKWAAIVFGLVLLQVALAFAAFSAPILGALHGLNALAILGTAIVAGRRAAPARRTEAAPAVRAHA